MGIFNDFSEEHKSLWTNSTCAILKSCAASREHPKKQRSIAPSDSSEKSSSAQSLAVLRCRFHNIFFAKGQNFVTLDDAELVKGWIRGNTKIGTVLEVAFSYHQGRHGIDIRIKSLFGGGSHSWVVSVHGLNKYVTEMSEETQGNRNDEFGDSAERLAAKAKTKTNTNADAIFSESRDTTSHAKMDRRRTGRVRPKLF